MSGHVSPKSTYYAIFGALMVLTGLTVAAAFVNLGSFNFPVAIGIAITKATLVLLFFMHVKYSSRLTKMIIGMAFFFLFILFGLTLTDYLSRGWHTSPRGSTGAGTSVGLSTTSPERAVIEPVGTEPEPGKNEPASAAH
jgi:cytochrome c oxidase subunit 4